MSARRLGDILPGILARAATMQSFQEMLNELPTETDRKVAILDARRAHFITDEDCSLLIQAYGVEHD
ncbi:hypothetical protein [Sphingopyxis sp. PET50]|uniref:hypothetical protein n=1 Tax=Sphingopyxis sp. PET50 TaxID=2976533 RepID=UPI0021AE51DA|nr:hypothetical protein [Sphingopyxis sp. PET50]